MRGHRALNHLQPKGPRHGLARALSKLGYCSRSQAWELIRAGRVKVNHLVRTDGEWHVDLQWDEIEVDGAVIGDARKVYLVLNKPRGLITTAQDEHGRDNVFSCLAGHGLPFVAPVGRLDKASEGLLLFTNDSRWAARLTDAASGVEKLYHVQVNRHPDPSLVGSIAKGITDGGEFLSARRVSLLRSGVKNSWLEMVLEEGRNRHIRRLLAAFELEVLRLIRVAIGPLALGNLAKGAFRLLSQNEISLLNRASKLVVGNLPNDGRSVDQSQDQ